MDKAENGRHIRKTSPRRLRATEERLREVVFACVRRIIRTSSISEHEHPQPHSASFVAKGMLPYHGIGSGIKRALADWPDITFTDDRDGCLFTASVRRKAVHSLTGRSSRTPQETPPITPSHVISAMSHSSRRAEENIRFSVGLSNTLDEITKTAERIISLSQMMR